LKQIGLITCTSSGHALWQRLLYVKKSEYSGWNGLSDVFDVDIEDGLFSYQSYSPGDLVVKFNGRLINFEELQSRQSRGLGGYFVECIPKRLFIDCYETRKNGACFASCANSAHKDYPLQHRTSLTLATSNVFIQVEIENNCWVAKYLASRHILAREEIFGEYRPF